jgi:hypothetical protein
MFFKMVMKQSLFVRTRVFTKPATVIPLKALLGVSSYKQGVKISSDNLECHLRGTTNDSGFKVVDFNG